MPKGYNAILKDLQSKVYSPVYWLQGEEPFFIDSIADYIEKNAIEESYKSFNQVVLYGKECKVADILGQARQFPMMADRRVVIVREAQDIPDFGKEEGEKAFLAYLEKPNPSTVLVFCYKYKTIDARKKVAKDLDRLFIVLFEKKINDYALPDWVKVFASSHEMKLTDRAVAMMAENIGSNLERMSNELKKIRINVPAGTTIDEHHVQRFVGISKDFNEFELQKAIGFGDYRKVFMIVQYFSANAKNHPLIPLIVILFGYFCKLLLLHKNSQASEDELARKLGVPPFYIKDYRIGARNFALPVVIRNIHLLKEADLQVKGITSASMEEGELLKELVFKLMQK